MLSHYRAVTRCGGADSGLILHPGLRSQNLVTLRIWILPRGWQFMNNAREKFNSEVRDGPTFDRSDSGFSVQSISES